MQISINGNPKQFQAKNMTIADLINNLNVVGKRIAIECNGEIVPRSQFANVMLKEGDKFEIVGAVGGG
ncbi:MAG: sulfur carrier protein ThiS [Methylophilaceae bacterium]